MEASLLALAKSIYYILLFYSPMEPSMNFIITKLFYLMSIFVNHQIIT